MIIDIADASKPVSLARCVTPGRAICVRVAGEHAYVADEFAGMQVFNVSNASAPVLAGNFSPGGSVHAWDIGGDFAYVLSTSNVLVRFEVVDVTNPGAPSSVWSHTAEGNGIRGDVRLAGDRVYVAANLWAYEGGEVLIFDVADPQQPRYLGQAHTPTAAAGVSVAGTMIYAGKWYHGVQVLGPAPGLGLVDWVPWTSATIELTGEPGTEITLEAAERLSTPTLWSTMATLQLGTFPVSFTDTDAGSATKFYRIAPSP